MKIKVKIVSRLENTGRLKGIATVCLEGQFLINGVRIVEGKKGFHVFMPSRKTEQGEYKDICFPITNECYKQLKEEVLKEFKREKNVQERG